MSFQSNNPSGDSVNASSKSIQSLSMANSSSRSSSDSSASLPSITLPKGGGSIGGMGEKFMVNAADGTGSVTIPISTSPSRGGFNPALSLNYNSGNGNGPFGLGWSLSEVSITRKTSKGLPQYDDSRESDVFLLGGVEDLVPLFRQNSHGETLLDRETGFPVIHEESRDGFIIRRYCPRVEGSFMRIERWTTVYSRETHWRVTAPNNMTSIYGSRGNSQIYDPSREADQEPRVFSWLLAEQYDSRGNAIIYEYKEENSEGISSDNVNERNRSHATRSSNRYLKTIKYGNKTPNRDPKSWHPFSAFKLPENEWMFTVILDYGELDDENPNFTSSKPWNYRKDPFSSYRSGFEIRTYRLCKRILMFHSFPTELSVDQYLVSSTDFSYDQQPSVTYLKSAQHVGYLLNGEEYRRKFLPPLEFEYSVFPTDDVLATLHVQDIDPESLKNIPSGVDGSVYQWADLDGEGLPGVLISGDDGWFYKRNMSTCKRDQKTEEFEEYPSFGALETIYSVSSISPSSGEASFTDVQGDGILDLVWMGNPTWGFFSRNTDSGAGWDGFRNFKSIPRISQNQTFKFIDLTGDGLPDILTSEDCAFVWFTSLGEDGYRNFSRTTPNTVENLPRLLFSDIEHSMYLADMSGDGLTDLVCIRNGEICFWPNIGYGQFAPKITMDNVPWFENDDSFNPKSILLADVDGSGTTDILYLGPNGIDSNQPFPSLPVRFCCGWTLSPHFIFLGLHSPQNI